MTPAKILALPMMENDVGAETVKDYLKALLDRLWEVEDGFSGKRPFGNSGWTHDLYKALVKGGAVKGTFDDPDEDGVIYHLDEFDEDAADRAIFKAIEAL